ncbi:MAG TPA: hypothetical protein VN901_27105 [Candidatus Acidoferrales bacterium]|nr:hypothetical protein [Candidatus Acidoferrales bacterium]
MQLLQAGQRKLVSHLESLRDVHRRSRPDRMRLKTGVRITASCGRRLHLEHVYVVGHDIGDMVAYAFARRYPETSRGGDDARHAAAGALGRGMQLKPIPLRAYHFSADAEPASATDCRA